MSAHTKTRSQGNLNFVFILATALIFLFAFLAGFQFDFTTLGYFTLIISSPVLVLLASDMKQMKKA